MTIVRTSSVQIKIATKSTSSVQIGTIMATSISPHRNGNNGQSTSEFTIKTHHIWLSNYKRLQSPATTTTNHFLPKSITTHHVHRRYEDATRRDDDDPTRGHHTRTPRHRGLGQELRKSTGKSISGPLSPTMLTSSTQSDYNDAAVAAQVEFDKEVEGFIASARDLLDSQGQLEWVEWAGEGIMPLTAQAKKELVEQGEAEQGEVEQGEVEQGEVEDRAAHFERRRDLLEASFEAGEVNSEEFARQMAAIYDEEDEEKVEEGGEPPVSEFEDNAKGDDESDPDAKGDGEPNRNDATTREPRDDDAGQPQTTDDETQPVTAP